MYQNGRLTPLALLTQYKQAFKVSREFAKGQYGYYKNRIRFHVPNDNGHVSWSSSCIQVTVILATHSRGTRAAEG